MSALLDLLNTYRDASQTEREKGTYFENLIIQYFKNEASYKDLYSNVWTFADWAELQGLPKNDAGIDLVAQTHGTNEFHAIQCKFYAADYRVQKADIDSFFTASGKKLFSHRIIVSTTNNWSTNAEAALENQNPPVSKIDLYDLENSQIDWSQFQPNKATVLKPKKSLRPHQLNALNSVEHGFKTAERGKLIMACGTGKTFTSLKIAEKFAGKGKHVLFLVPSLSLLSQTLTEWTQESDIPLHSFAVCSDSDVGKKRNEDDPLQTFTHELRYPATTEPNRLALEMQKRHDDDHMSVVFSTYHSIDVISKAQKEFGLADFDLIVCDEAHRTTGATFDDEDESNFVKVHDAAFIKGIKRLYMTATPRIYGDTAKASAEKDNVALCSMDDEALYGKELYVITFSEAVRLDLLVDYKVIVLAVDESHVNRRLQALLADDDNQLKVDDAAKIVGCWKALSKQDTQEDLTGDAEPMRRAVAFCQVIEPTINGKSRTHKVSSKNIANMFADVVEAYKAQELEDTFDNNNPSISLKLNCEAEHVDGGMNASQKEAKLSWLKAEPPAETCRILSNVRCLSEGVDVPALDAVLFLTPRNSQVDVVQSVGRVMRKAEGKKRGYVILPVVIPADMEAHEALNDNKTYKVVWQVLQALRSHDDRFDAMVNKLDLIGRDTSKMEVIAITDKITHKPKSSKDENGEKIKNKNAGRGGSNIGKSVSKPLENKQASLDFEIGEIERAIYAKVVQKCGNRSHWEDWANDIAKIAKTHIDRIRGILGLPPESQKNKEKLVVLPDSSDTAKCAFLSFADELKDDLNDSISHSEIIEMLAQHLITKPVFDALFEDYSFASKNPMSLAMQEVLNVLNAYNIQKEADTLQRFYDSVKMRAQGIDNASGKQKIVVELYDKFFRNAFPKMTERLGIVYTPVEVVDFILHSVNDVLQNEFGQSLGSDNVHIIDPFTGTGTFITRLMQSGLISKDKLAYKYKNEIHANEIVLLAYYIAAINIESVYHDIADGEYEPFKGICLTDTFQLHEKNDLVSSLLVDNSARRNKQKALDIRVIIGNPPYSVGQKNANDNNANISYPNLDKRIYETYAKNSKAKSTKNLVDSYIRAIRWASDRVGDEGVVGFITNSGYLDSASSDGLRQSLVNEFSKIYVFNLRGSIRGRSGDLAKKEGQNIFNILTGVAIIILVKNKNLKDKGEVNYFDIGDYLSRKEKLEKISNIKSISNLTLSNSWLKITPDSFGDWLRQRDESFSQYIVIGGKDSNEKFFNNYSLGVATGRDTWCYNFSKSKVTSNITKFIDFYNAELMRLKPVSDKKDNLEDYISYDLSKISWNDTLKKSLAREENLSFSPNSIVKALYRPFSKQWMYFNKKLNERTYQMFKVFPQQDSENKVIVIKGNWKGNGQIALISNCVVDLHPDGGVQCFPEFLYSENNSHKKQENLFMQVNNNLQESAISSEMKNTISKKLNDESINSSDIFYYVYGLLHSKTYLETYRDNLGKELPRIPIVKKSEDFWTFSKAGRKLAELHINYETVLPYPVEFQEGNLAVQMLNEVDYRVIQMKFAKGKDGEKYDKTKVIYNSKITITKIPLEAYDYVVNGKSALEWVMERQAITTHKESGIVNDANDWAIETMQNPKYPLELFQRVITVSLETMKIVRSLPNLEI